jgi:hypothetical protein
MINALTSLGYGIIGLAIMIGIGIVILVTLGSNVASTSPTANATIYTLSGYLGTGSGGLASWVPIIIVLVIGMLFLGAFLNKRGMSA